MVPGKEPPFQDPMLPRQIMGLERFHSTLRNICEGSYLWVSLRLDVMALSLRSLRSGQRCVVSLKDIRWQAFFNFIGSVIAHVWTERGRVRHLNFLVKLTTLGTEK